MRIEPRARTKQEADRCEAWYSSENGAFALARQRKVIKRFLADWPRRQQSLLEIDCGPGFLLETFYTAGFSVSASESCPELLSRARARLPNQVDLHLAQAEHLPFEDREFDYSALICGLDFSPQPGRAILEAARVAKKGMLIGFLNKYSLAGLGRRFFAAGSLYPFSRARWFSPWSLATLITTSTGYRPVAMTGLLPGPMFTWRESAPWRQVNGVNVPSCLGCMCLAKIEFIEEPALTPLMALTSGKSLTGPQEQVGYINSSAPGNGRLQ